MIEVFMKKYHEYYKGSRDETLGITQCIYESLEDYVEHFHFTQKWDTNCEVSPNSLKLVFLREIIEELLETVNLIALGYICRFTYDEIIYLLKN